MPDGPLGVRHKSFAPQPLDLLLRFYVYLLDFGLCCNLIHRLALYQVSVRRLKSFATPLPPLLTLLSAACGSLHLAVTTRDRTFTCKICVMPDTPQKPCSKNCTVSRMDGYSIKRISQLHISQLQTCRCLELPLTFCRPCNRT